MILTAINTEILFHTQNDFHHCQNKRLILAHLPREYGFKREFFCGMGDLHAPCTWAHLSQKVRMQTER